MSDTLPLSVTVNGAEWSVEIDTRRLLVEVIRDELGQPGTHIGCLTGDCGACTVEVDGQIVKSCMVLAASAEGSEITTIEGLAEDGELSTIQQAFWDEYGFQCGFCLPGMLFAAKDLLEAEHESDRGRDPVCHQRQPLPVHRLRHDREVDRGGGAENGYRLNLRVAPCGGGVVGCARARQAAP